MFIRIYSKQEEVVFSLKRLVLDGATSTVRIIRNP